ncbi:uncharacterized protein LOC142839836 [Microtus pennsylvanicus]|uniref:uncharacterized protein LOC142839836 n=1 Tax=Microtus pennsylvanicus TaxID=10058 RepID=UPI003F6D5B7F
MAIYVLGILTNTGRFYRIGKSLEKPGPPGRTPLLSIPQARPDPGFHPVAPEPHALPRSCCPARRYLHILMRGHHPNHRDRAGTAGLRPAARLGGVGRGHGLHGGHGWGWEPAVLGVPRTRRMSRSATGAREATDRESAAGRGPRLSKAADTQLLPLPTRGPGRSAPQSLTQARALLGAGPTEAGRAKLCQRWSAGVQWNPVRIHTQASSSRASDVGFP